jgi:hypothetical protein
VERGKKLKDKKEGKVQVERKSRSNPERERGKGSRRLTSWELAHKM